MTINSSGQVSLAGGITGQSVDIELGYTSSTTISLNDAAVRGLLQKPSGQISLSDAWGKSHTASVGITITSNTTNFNIWNSRGGSYVAGSTHVVVTNNSVIGTVSVGAYALDTGSGWSGSDTIAIINNGYIAGHGGRGGDGAGNGAHGMRGPGNPGYAGGPAMYLRWNVTITNGSGYIYGGGGGGGGGAVSTNCYSFFGAGGGGAGYYAGSHGASASRVNLSEFAQNGGLFNGGQPGGGGGCASGGYGGGPGASGQVGGSVSSQPGGAGGGHGYAIVTNGHGITWISGSGRVYGGVV